MAVCVRRDASEEPGRHLARLAAHVARDDKRVVRAQHRVHALAHTLAV